MDRKMLFQENYLVPKWSHLSIFSPSENSLYISSCGLFSKLGKIFCLTLAKNVNYSLQSYDMKYSVGAAYASVPPQKNGEAMKSNLGFGSRDGGRQSCWRKFALSEW